MRASAWTKALSLVVLLAIVLSCSTISSNESGSAPGKVDLDLLITLAAEDPEAVFEKLTVWSLEGLLAAGADTAKASTIAEAAADRLAALLSEALGKGAWKEARRLWSSLSAVSGLSGELFMAAASRAAMALSKGMASRIAMGEAREYRDKGLYAPAVSALLEALGSEKDSKILDVQEGKNWLALMKKAGDGEAVARLGAQTGLLASDIPSSTVPKASIKEEVSGVVTVYIDKGLKIENGVGYPDRVLGTAFQIDPEGYYLTNYHVIASEVDPEYEGYSRLSIRPSAKPEARIPAKVVGWNRALDLALIKSSEKAGYTFSLEGAEEIEKGTKVYAIGSPVGLENSLTSGIVSAQGRRILSRGEALQIDVSVNPGNSGGPLVTEEGRLAGIVFAGLPNFQGLNFALPAPWIELITPKLFDGGEIATVSLGLAAAQNLDESLSVSYVFPGTPCFKPGDRILSLDGRPVKDLNDAQMILAAKPLGSLCIVGIERERVSTLVPRRTVGLENSGLKKTSKSDTVENLFAGAAGLLINHLSGPKGDGGTYKVLKAWPGMAGDESGLSEGDSLLLIRSAIDQKAGSLSFDVMVKAPSKGYLERAMRLTLSMEMDNFL
ncbi:MAG: trypsin-like peptidase domain-containing protein [Spirochaetes bacterium]|nr:trypsin-like peptidase domain-containing protein [Spirochaetota bacterium]